MSADNEPNAGKGEAGSSVSRREVLFTVLGLAAAVLGGALAWGGLELVASKDHALGSDLNITYLQVVRVLGTVACVVGVLLCIRTARARFDDAGTAGKEVNLGVARVPALAWARLIALLALVVVPAGAVFLANYHTFEGVHEVKTCGSCHVMLPMVNDMQDPESKTLAALHYKNKWIAENQCYHCHSNYGLGGDLEAKLTGFRHLARYTTGTYHEPITARVTVENASCLHCHEGTPKFVKVEMHTETLKDLVANEARCVDCHSEVHPTREQRTPGSSDYPRLMEAMK